MKRQWHWQSTNISRHSTNLYRPGDLATGICTNCDVQQPEYRSSHTDRLRDRRPEVRVPVCKTDFSVPRKSQTGAESHPPPPIQWVKRPQGHADHSSLSCAKFKTKRGYTSLPSIRPPGYLDTDILPYASQNALHYWSRCSKQTCPTN